MSDPGSNRIVNAPSSVGPGTADTAFNANRVQSVSLGPKETVEWIWTYLSDGSRFVSGYTIKTEH